MADALTSAACLFVCLQHDEPMGRRHSWSHGSRWRTRYCTVAHWSQILCSETPRFGVKMGDWAYCWTINLHLEFILPNTMKIAKIVAMYKTGNNRLFTNYRPDSLLPHFSKILEKPFNKKLEQFIDKHALLNSSQYMFWYVHWFPPYCSLMFSNKPLRPQTEMKSPSAWFSL